MRSIFSSGLVTATAYVLAAALAGCSSAETGVSTRGADGTGQDPASGGTNGGSTGTGDNGATPGSGTTTPPSGNPGSGTPAPTGGAGTISADETWDTGKTIDAPVTIAAGATVTIAPGAQITVADAATITVAGTLKGTSTAAAHAKLTGKAWGGIVASGAVTLDGVDLENAATALHAQKGGNATIANGALLTPGVPFMIDAGGKLAFSHASVVKANGIARVAGQLVASYLDYDANGNEGIAATDAAAVLTIDDSIFHSNGTTSGDMIVANNAATVHVAHTEITKCHCAFHFSAITSFDVSFMNVHDDAYGFMMYGSDAKAGTRTVDSSNFKTLAVGVAESGTNGPITVSNCYYSAVTTTYEPDAQQAVKMVTPAKNPVPGVGPRP